MAMQWFADLWTWWNSLPRDMKLFFSLPFMVAAAGLLVHTWCQRHR